MKYGIIGTGWIAESFIEGVRLKTKSEISAVYSRTEEKGKLFADKNNIKKVYTDLISFAAGDFDAVYIASPNSFHYSQSKLMLQNGKNVICEKPITVKSEELTELQALAKEKNLIYMEAIMYLHQPCREILRENFEKLGNIKTAHFDFSQLSSKYPALLRGENPNIFNPEMATGGMMDLGIYCLYPAVDLFGDNCDVKGFSYFLETGADGAGSVILNYKNALVSITYSKIGQDNLGSQIIGDNGCITIESISRLAKLFFISNNGDKKEIYDEISKAELMGNEAVSFEKFISGENLDYYGFCSDMALKVSRLMEKVRTECGIKFNGSNYD